MAVPTLDYIYDSPSILQSSNGSKGLLFSKFNEDTKSSSPCFYWGQIVDPFVVARCLITLSQIVRSNFSFNARQLALLKDPIVTSGNEQVRFEAFSTCAGIYGRVDLLPDGQNGEFIESGTTNVDFNLPLITELNRIKKSDKLILSIGKKDVGFHKDGGSIIERKVPLPSKWIKGLTSVQFYLSESESAIKLNKIEALQLLKSLPLGVIKKDLYVIKRSNRYMFSLIKSKSAICIGGAHRLQLLSPLMSLAQGLTIYKHKDDQSVNFTLHFGRVNFVFTLSRSAFRGFSGEGAGLMDMIGNTQDNLINAFDNYAFENQIFNPMDIALGNNIDIQKIDNLSAKLAAMGLLGYDLELNSYFYRRLPFKLSRILSLNPRLSGAEQLILKNKIQIIKDSSGRITANVEGSKGEQYFVAISANSAKCTCIWYSKHQGERGHCKHILATIKTTDKG